MKGRTWPKALILLAILAVLAFLTVGVARLALGFLRENSSSYSSGEADPMFAEAAATERPAGSVLQPEEEESIARDHSSEWDTPVNTPVDKTADELIGLETGAVMP